MRYAKILVKNNYEQRGDLVLRSYVRALKKISEGRLLDGDNAVIYGVIADDGKFYELFTNEVIDYDNYVYVDIEEIFDTYTMPNNRKELLKKIIEKVLFDKKVDLNIEISTMEELARDRSIEFDAYNNYLSRINPYTRLLSDEEQYKYNAYNSFGEKIKEIKKMSKKDHKVDIDEYEVLTYYQRPEEEKEEKYLVFEVPKTLVKRK